MTRSHSDDLHRAQRAAMAGAQVGLRYFSRVGDLTPEQKADGSLVTQADRDVEAAIKLTLIETCPTDAFLGEETGESGRGRRRWILDGIDGTSVFVTGDDRWQSLVALEVDGRVTVGVCIVPAQQTIWYAARGHGAFAARFSDDSIAELQRLTTETRRAQGKHDRIGVLPPVASLPPVYRAQAERVVAGVGETPWRAHAALLVATGEFDIAVQFGGHLWDYAALSLIVEEAGGVAVAEDGTGFPLEGTVVFARTMELTTRVRHALPGTH